MPEFSDNKNVERDLDTGLNTTKSITPQHSVLGFTPEEVEEFRGLLKKYLPKPIRSQEEYDHYFEIVEDLGNKKDLSLPENEIMTFIGTLLDVFTEERFQGAEPREILATLMQERSLSQNQLSAQTGVAQPTISCILSGKRQVSQNCAKRLGEFFGVSKSLLFSLE